MCLRKDPMDYLGRLLHCPCYYQNISRHRIVNSPVRLAKIKFVCLKCLKNRYFVTTIKWRKIHWYLKYLRNVVNDSLMTHEKIINKILCIHFFIYELLNYIKKKTKV